MEPDDIEERLERLYESASSASAEGRSEDAIKLCDEALDLIESAGDDTESYSYSAFVMLIGDVHWGAGDYEDAYQAYHKVALNDPERIDARVAVGVALFHLCRFQAAQTQLEMCSLDDAGSAEAWYYLGLIALRRGQRDLAMRHFTSANELEEERFKLPVAISEKEVVEIVERLIQEIPPALAKPLVNVPIILEKRPDEELLFSEDPPMDPLILGLFDGIPLTEMTSDVIVTAPTRIILFLDNIWLVAHDRATLEDELWVTLKHEIGHYLGLNEDELAERGLD
ncbi:tetratricopeptide repeat protein [bacterium]|nr:tetratricopeptide repeat protein [bacterium]